MQRGTGIWSSSRSGDLVSFDTDSFSEIKGTTGPCVGTGIVVEFIYHYRSCCSATVSLNRIGNDSSGPRKIDKPIFFY